MKNLAFFLLAIGVLSINSAFAQSKLYQCYNFYGNKQTEYLLYKPNEGVWLYYTSNNPKKTTLLTSTTSKGWKVSFPNDKSKKVYLLNRIQGSEDIYCVNPDGKTQLYKRISD
jgi:hypothetical protein